MAGEDSLLRAHPPELLHLPHAGAVAPQKRQLQEAAGPLGTTLAPPSKVCKLDEALQVDHGVPFAQIVAEPTAHFPEPLPLGDSVELAGEWCRKLTKKEKRQKKKMYKNYPSFVLNSNAYKTPISTKDVGRLYTFLLGAGSTAQKWILAKNQSNIRRVVLLLIPCLRYDIFYTADRGSPVPIGEMDDPLGLLGHFRALKEIFSIACPCNGPYDGDRLFDPFRSLTEVSLSKGEKRQRAASGEATTSSRSSEISYEHYQLTLADMVLHGYPIPSAMDPTSVLPRGYVETRPAVPAGGSYEIKTRIVGLDCEMCETSEGLELTRVTLVDEQGTIIYDKFVKPDNEIIDYLSRWSGVTPDHMANTTTTLREVQEDILKIVDHSVILVGHSLECDLVALKLAHPRIIDTAIMFPRHSGSLSKKRSLKSLAYALLGRRIQSGGEEGDRLGHCSAEDALACIDLLKAKITNGPAFGIHARDSEPVFVRLKKLKPPKKSAVVDTAVALDGVDKDEQPDSIVTCRDDDETVSQLLKVFESAEDQGPHLIMSCLREIEKLYEDLAAGNDSDIPEQPAIERISDAYRLTNARLEKLWAAMPPFTAFIVASFGQDPRYAKRLARRKHLSKLSCSSNSSASTPQPKTLDTLETDMMDLGCDDSGIADKQQPVFRHPSFNEQWTEGDENLLQKTIKRAVRGVAFFTVK